MASNVDSDAASIAKKRARIKQEREFLAREKKLADEEYDLDRQERAAAATMVSRSKIPSRPAPMLIFPGCRTAESRSASSSF